MDLYIVLGLPQGATEADIKRAYRRLARRFHPDINPGDRVAEARFRQIVDAYETLIDPGRRSRYDAGQGFESQRERPKSGFEGFDFSTRGVDYSASFGDLFAEVLHERGAARGRADHRGADLHQDMPLSFEEALAGGERRLTVTRRVTCRTCAGTGRTRTSPGPCQRCQASGSIRSVRGHMVFTITCTACGGTGQQQPRACDRCAGGGQEMRSESVAIRVPPGVADGERLRVQAKGNGGSAGGPPGDLYVTVQVAPDPRFRRDGDDLHTTVAIAIHEAALGARLEVQTPDGVARVRIPPGTQSGQRFRLRERGAPSSRDGRRGDLVVEVQLMLPTVLDERSKELLREFGRINGDVRR